MTIEIPTLEVLVILFSVYAFKWFFRLLFVLFLGKIASNLKGQAEEKLKGLKGKGKQENV